MTLKKIYFESSWLVNVLMMSMSFITGLECVLNVWLSLNGFQRFIKILIGVSLSVRCLKIIEFKIARKLIKTRFTPVQTGFYSDKNAYPNQ